MSSDIIVDLNPTVQYRPGRSTKAEVLEAIVEIVMRRTGVDLTGEFTVRLDPDTEEVTISMCGVTLDGMGDIAAPPKKEYHWNGTVTIEVRVNGIIEAASEEEAEEMAENILASIEADSTPEVSSCEGEGEVDEYSVACYGEVTRVEEV
jgi:hypothetical protein